MIKVSQPKFVKTLKYFSQLKSFNAVRILQKHGKAGVDALRKATPVDTSEAANSWSYKITGNSKRYVLSWNNSVMAGSVPLVVLLHYGHGTRGGTYVAGRNFINPALDPIFDAIKADLLEEVLV